MRLSELNSTSILTKGVNPIQFNCLQSSSNYNNKHTLISTKKKRSKRINYSISWIKETLFYPSPCENRLY